MADTSTQTAGTVGLVTVGLPTYNRRKPLARAVRSVLQQSYRPLRLLVSDNASDDGTAADLAELDAAHPEVRVLTSRINTGPSANFENVRSSSQGEYFMWLGDDDWLDPTYIESCMRELRADATLVMVAGACRYHAEGHHWRETPLIELTHPDGYRRVLDYFRSVGANGVFYGLTRRSALDVLPPVPNLMGGDWLHMARLAFLGGIRTLETTEVHRSVGGATRNLAQVARHQGLGWWSRNAPQIVLACSALADVAWRSPVYQQLGRVRRVRLGTHVASIVVARFLPRAATKFFRLHSMRLSGQRSGSMDDPQGVISQ